jgi:hypothetical protein
MKRIKFSLGDAHFTVGWPGFWWWRNSTERYSFLPREVMRIVTVPFITAVWIQSDAMRAVSKKLMRKR